jgi:hypothetical protein
MIETILKQFLNLAGDTQIRRSPDKSDNRDTVMNDQTTYQNREVLIPVLNSKIDQRWPSQRRTFNVFEAGRKTD